MLPKRILININIRDDFSDFYLERRDVEEIAEIPSCLPNIVKLVSFKIGALHLIQRFKYILTDIYNGSSTYIGHNVNGQATGSTLTFDFF